MSLEPENVIWAEKQKKTKITDILKFLGWSNLLTKNICWLKKIYKYIKIFFKLIFLCVLGKLQTKSLLFDSFNANTVSSCTFNEQV